MKHTRCGLITLLALAVGLISVPRQTLAQTSLTFAFTGEVTGVDDVHNWFQNTYSVGMPISGTYTFYTSGYQNLLYSGDPNTHGYHFIESPKTHPDFRIGASGKQVISDDANVIPFVIDVTDNGGPLYGPGDTYHLQSSIQFPSFFHDPSGDPNFDPNGDFYTLAYENFLLQDPNGNALASNNLPLTPPDLSAFSVRSGQISIFDGNDGFTDQAQLNFRIRTLQAVPEPGICSLFAGFGMIGLNLLICRNRKRARDASF